GGPMVAPALGREDLGPSIRRDHALGTHHAPLQLWASPRRRVDLLLRYARAPGLRPVLPAVVDQPRTGHESQPPFEAGAERLVLSPTGFRHLEYPLFHRPRSSRLGERGPRLRIGRPPFEVPLSPPGVLRRPRRRCAEGALGGDRGLPGLAERG